jgi:hypothetical protein
MKSEKSYSILDLNNDLPTSPGDILALKRVRQAQRLSFDSYLEFLTSFAPLSPEELRTRKGPFGLKPFEL